LVVALLIAGAGTAAAAGYGTGKVRPGWYSYPGGIIFFYIDGPNGGHVDSACPASPTRWAIDTSTQDGKNAFAQLMLAFCTDRAVSVWGFDGVPCVHGNTEVAVQFMVL
jgi:hypothetical protein